MTNMTHQIDISERRSILAPLTIAGALFVTISLLILASVRAPFEQRARLGKAVQVRLDEVLADRLAAIEQHAHATGRTEFTKSQMIRDAVAAYLDPLVTFLDDGAAPDRETPVDLPSERSGHWTFSETTRIRFDADVVEQLDRVEAYARGLGQRHITRSSLIREGVRSYLAGFEAEMAQHR